MYVRCSHRTHGVHASVSRKEKIHKNAIFKGIVENGEVERERMIGDVGTSVVMDPVDQSALGVKRPNNSCLIMGSGCAEANVGTF